MAELWDDEQVSEALAGLTDWQREGDAIARTTKLPTFTAAIEAVRAVAEIAESRDHHPDMDIRCAPSPSAAARTPPAASPARTSSSRERSTGYSPSSPESEPETMVGWTPM